MKLVTCEDDRERVNPVGSNNGIYGAGYYALESSGPSCDLII